MLAPLRPSWPPFEIEGWSLLEVRPLLHSFDDAHVSDRSVTKRLKRLLIGRTIVSGDCLFEARKLDNQNSFLEARS